VWIGSPSVVWKRAPRNTERPARKTPEEKAKASIASGERASNFEERAAPSAARDRASMPM
jgi:hypothetical protein